MNEKHCTVYNKKGANKNAIDAIFTFHGSYIMV